MDSMPNNCNSLDTLMSKESPNPSGQVTLMTLKQCFPLNMR